MRNEHVKLAGVPYLPYTYRESMVTQGFSIHMLKTFSKVSLHIERLPIKMSSRKQKCTLYSSMNFIQNFKEIT